MHHNNIKLIVRKQLKTQSPDWKRLPKKTRQHVQRQLQLHLFLWHSRRYILLLQRLIISRRLSL